MASVFYGWKSGSIPQACGYIVPAIISLLALHKPKRDLDLGSGNGVLCKQLYNLGISVVGAELSTDGVNASRDLIPTVNFYQIGVEGDPCEIASTEGLFDVVASTEVIEHLYSPHLLPAFASKCLKKGGVIILSTPYHGYIKNLMLSIFGKWDHHHTPLWCGGHIKFWSKVTLSRLLDEQGFKVESFHGVGRLPWLWKSMILVARKCN